MKSYLIALKLNLPETSYTNLINYLKTAPQWAHPFESTWIVQTEIDLGPIRDGVMGRVNKNDSVLVVEIVGKRWATNNVTIAVTDWMHKNL